MIDRVVIQNFRCLRSVDVPLRPLTVLIGPNDSGKSSFLRSVSYAGRGKVPRQEFWRQDADSPAEITLYGGPHLRGEGEEIAKRSALSAFTPVHLTLPASGPAMACAGVNEVGVAPPVTHDNVAAILDWMLRRDRSRYAAFEGAVQASLPGVQEVLIATPTSSQRRVDLRIEGDFTVPADEASGGVRLMLFFLTLAWHPSPPPVILLEEPENGIHPQRLAEVMDLLRGLTQGKHAPHETQVILTTHSPYLLDRIDHETDQVLVFQRGDDGACTARPLDPERLSAFLDEFMLGEIWTNEGEQGLVS